MENRNYWIHRITGGVNGQQLSYELLHKHQLLSIGWADFSNGENMFAIMQNGDAVLKKIYQTAGWRLSRSRWCLIHFLKDMKCGDYVVVPTYKHFQVFEIVGESPLWVDQIVNDLPENYTLIDKNGHKYIKDKNDRIVDVGFFWQVRPICDSLSREDYAESNLVSRMKVRMATANISDISDSVDAAIRRERPIDSKAEIIKRTSSVVHEQISKFVTPNKFEKLVEWYLYKIGADLVSTPAKNYSPTEEGDADKVAVFERLKLVVLVQVKNHEGTTGEWAVTQISSFDTHNEFKGYTKVMWVVSSAKSFSNSAKEQAEEKGVRLINGEDFAKMIVEEGLSSKYEFKTLYYDGTKK